MPPNFPQTFDSVEQVQNYIPKVLEQISKMDSKNLTETEARFIKYYTMNENSYLAYEKINRFMREHGKIDDLDSPNTATLQSIMLTLLFLPQAIMKLRNESDNQATQQLFRGENYKSGQAAARVVAKRSENPMVEAPGFISTTVERETVDTLFSNKPDEKKNARVFYLQGVNSVGVDISSFSENPGEKEVIISHGEQTVYKKTPYASNTLIATNVRSVDEIYSGNYQPELIALRDKVMQEAAAYKNDPECDPVILRMMQDFSAAACVYAPAELVNTAALCDEYCRRAYAIILTPENKAVLDQFTEHLEEMNEIANSKIDEMTLPALHRIIAAAKYAYENHLSLGYDPAYTKAYDDDVNLEFELDGAEHVIERPNHGLAHAVRKALYIPVVINALHSHAADKGFKDYLGGLDQGKIELLQIAMLFSVSGRKSEAGSTQNKKHYKEYRELSKKNFLKYAEDNHYLIQNPITEDEKNRNAFINLLGDQIQNMGDVKYMARMKREGNKEGEYVFHAIKWSHNPDMLRSIDVGKFKGIINSTFKHSSYLLDDTFEERAIPTLLKMAQQAIHATGDRSLTTFENGNLTGTVSDYDVEKFHAASTDAESCIKMCLHQTPVMMEVLNGKLQVDTLPKGISMNPLQEAFLNEDANKVLEIMSNPALGADDISPFMRLLYQFTCENDVDAEIVLKQILDQENTVDPADLIAALSVTLALNDTDLLEKLMNNNVDLNYVNQAGELPLHIAVVLGNVDMVKMLIPHTTNINDSDNEDYTPLMRAVKLKKWDLVTEILKAPNIDLSSYQGAFTFFAAVASNETRIAETMLNKNVDINFTYTDDRGDTPLHLAIYNGMNGVAEELAKRMKSVDMVNDDGDSPLMFACKEEQWRVVECLLQRDDVDLNIRNEYGNTPLHMAVLQNSKMARLMLEKGADIEARNNCGDTPLQLLFSDVVYESVRLYAVEIILNHDTSFMANADRDGNIPIFQAVESKSVPLINLMLNYQDANLRNHTNDKGNTLIMHAIRLGSWDIVKELLDIQKIDLDYENNDGENILDMLVNRRRWDIFSELLPLADLDKHKETLDEALFSACADGTLSVVRQLQQKGLSLNMTNFDGNTSTSALHIAAENGHIFVVRYLLAQGVDVTHESATGKTPLHLAAEHGLTKIVTAFMEAGCDLNALTNPGNPPVSALMLAAENGEWRVVEKLLSQKNIDINGVNEQGMNVLQLAQKTGNSRIIKLIQEKAADTNAMKKSAHLGQTIFSKSIPKQNNNHTEERVDKPQRQPK